MNGWCATLAGFFLFLLVWAGASAEAPSAAEPSETSGRVDASRADVQHPVGVSQEGPGSPAALGQQRAVAPDGTPQPVETVYEVDLGKVWYVSPEYFRKVFDGADDPEPSGLNEKIDLHIHGVIRTRWGPADMLFGSMARFFAASPVMLDRDYAVRRALLFD